MHCLQVPESLKLILLDPSVRKIARQVAGDAAKLERDYSISIPKESLIELGDLCKKAGMGCASKWLFLRASMENCGFCTGFCKSAGLGLATLSNMVLERSISGKDDRTVVNWEVQLDSGAQQYAARDAKAHFLIHEVAQEKLEKRMKLDEIDADVELYDTTGCIKLASGTLKSLPDEGNRSALVEVSSVSAPGATLRMNPPGGVRTNVTLGELHMQHNNQKFQVHWPTTSVRRKVLRAEDGHWYTAKEMGMAVCTHSMHVHSAASTTTAYK